MGRVRFGLRTWRRKAWAGVSARRRQVGWATVRRSWPVSKRTAAAGLVAAVLVVGVVTWAVAGGGGRSPEATVRAFFDARRDGDCARLVELVSEASWSEGGRLDRDRFVESCAAVVRRYRPQLHEVSVVSEHDAQAVVQVAVRLDRDHAPAGALEGLVGQAGGPDLVVTEGQSGLSQERAYGDAHLVREGGDWRVEIDGSLLRIGRSIEETVVGYIQAYNDGACDRVVGYLSRAAREATGARSRGELVDRCTADVEARRDAILPGTDPPAEISMPSAAWSEAGPVGLEVEVTFPPGDRTRAVAEWGGAPREVVSLVREGLTWKLDQPHLAAEGYVELRRLVLPEAAAGYAPVTGTAVFPGGQPRLIGALLHYEGTDAVERRREAGFERGIRTTYWRDNDAIDLMLYVFDNAEGASAYARHLAGRVSSKLDPRVSPPPPSDAFRVLTRCGEDDACQHATGAVALGVRGNVLVGVEVSDVGGAEPTADQVLGLADQVLEAQRTRLADQAGGA